MKAKRKRKKKRKRKTERNEKKKKRKRKREKKKKKKNLIEKITLLYYTSMGIIRLKGVLGPVSRKSPKLFGRISVDIILFVSSKRRRLEARNFAVIFIFIPFTTYEKTSFTE